MPHETALIAIGLAFALIGGYIAVRVHLPPLVGYLVAGIAVGPFTPGFVADQELAPQLAEIVILLMFGVGMHFSLHDLLAVRGVALPCALAQIVLATVLGVGVAMAWGWSLGAGLVFGLALSVASTVVLLRALEARGLLESGDGRIAVGWLIVEDLVIVLALVLLPALAGPLGGQALDGSPAPGNLWITLGLTLGKIALFAVLMLVVGVRLFPWLLKVLAIIVVGKSLAAFGIVLALRHPLGTALSVSAALAQIGEFSFILAGLGVSLGLLPPEGNSLILAGAILSITLNPLLFTLVSRLQIARPA